MRQTYDAATGKWVPSEDYWARKAARMAEKRSALPCPQIMSDIAEYVSPLGTGVIGSRSQRREELKRHNCREVDPSEFKPSYVNPKNRARQKRASS